MAQRAGRAALGRPKPRDQTDHCKCAASFNAAPDDRAKGSRESCAFFPEDAVHWTLSLIALSDPRLAKRDRERAGLWNRTQPSSCSFWQILLQPRRFLERDNGNLTLAFFHDSPQEHRFSRNFIKIQTRDNLSWRPACRASPRMATGGLGVVTFDFTGPQASAPDWAASQSGSSGPFDLAVGAGGG